MWVSCLTNCASHLHSMKFTLWYTSWCVWWAQTIIIVFIGTPGLIILSCLVWNSSAQEQSVTSCLETSRYWDFFIFWEYRCGICLDKFGLKKVPVSVSKNFSLKKSLRIVSKMFGLKKKVSVSVKKVLEFTYSKIESEIAIYYFSSSCVDIIFQSDTYK